MNVVAEKFSFYGSYLEVAQKMGPEDRLSFYDAIATYGITGEVPDMTMIAEIAFTVARHSIDKSIEVSKKNAENGRRGGRPRKDGGNKKPTAKPTEKPTAKPTDEESEPSVKADVDVDVDEDVDVDVDVDGGSKGGAAPQAPRNAPRFKPPSLAEVREYGEQFCRDRGIPPDVFDPEEFVDYWTSVGWRRGRTAMKDWRATLRNRVRDNAKRAGIGGGEGGNQQHFSDALRRFDEGAEVVDAIA